MLDELSQCYSALELGSKEVTGGIICLHKGRGKTLQSDSCGAKEWGTDRGTDKDREKVRVKSRAGKKCRKKEKKQR